MILTKYVKTAFFGVMLFNVAGCVTTPPAPPTTYVAYPIVAQTGQVERVFVLNFANQAAISAYSYDFVNYQDSFNRTSQYFSKTGWRNFDLALRESGVLDRVIQKKLVVSAVETGAPLISQEQFQKYSRTYSWWVQVPLLVEYQSAYASEQQHMIIQLYIVESPDVPGKLQVETFIAKPLNN